MAFPGTYNISYYKGDTLEFSIYPKNSAGAQFQLNDYTQFRFTISNVLGSQVIGGPTKVTIDAFAEKRDNQYVLCAITPDNGTQMVAGTTYYYDVEIGRISSPYDYVYTLLSGTVSVSEQITPPVDIPGSPQNLDVTNLTTTSGTVSWSKPAGTVPVLRYNVYAVMGSTRLKLGQVDTPGDTNSYVVTIPSPPGPLIPGVPYVIGVTAENVSGESVIATKVVTIPIPS